MNSANVLKINTNNLASSTDARRSKHKNKRLRLNDSLELSDWSDSEVKSTKIKTLAS
jgi:hypothetical protein